MPVESWYTMALSLQVLSSPSKTPASEIQFQLTRSPLDLQLLELDLKSDRQIRPWSIALKDLPNSIIIHNAD